MFALLQAFEVKQEGTTVIFLLLSKIRGLWKFLELNILRKQFNLPIYWKQ